MADKKQLLEFPYQDAMGNVSAYYVDPVTNEQIDDINNMDLSEIENLEIVDGYTGETKASVGGEEDGEYEEDKGFMIPEGNNNSQGTTPEQVSPSTAANNYGYVDQPRAFDFVGALPGVNGLFGKAMEGVFSANNAIAKNKARESMALPTQSIAKQAMAEVGLKNSQGHIADVSVNNQDYSVGFEALDAAGRTTLTPNEARMRGLTSVFGMQELSKDVSKQNIKDFKAHPAEPKAATPAVAPTGQDLPSLGRNAFDLASPQGDDLISPAQPAQTMQPGMGLMGVSPSFADKVESMGTQGTISTFDRTGLSPEANAMADSMAAHGYGNLGVNSGYRSPSANAAAGGARGSQHMHGNAMDLATRGMTDQQKADTLDAAMVGGAKGIGTYASGALHVDTRDNPATWGPAGYTGSNIFAGTPEEQAAAMSMMPGWSRDNLQALKDAEGEQYLSKYGPVPAEKPAQQPSSLEMSNLGLMGQPPGASLPGMPNQISAKTDYSAFGAKPEAWSSEEDRDLAAKTLAGEIDLSKTDLSTELGRQEAMGIMSTIDNRVATYGTVKDTITAPSQYSTWNNQTAAATAEQNFAKDPDMYRGLVDSYLANPKENNLGFTSYHADFVSPSWSAQMQNKTTIGPHEFGLLPEYANVAAQTAAASISPALSQQAAIAATQLNPSTAFSPQNQQKDTGPIGQMGAIGQVGQAPGGPTSSPQQGGLSNSGQSNNSSIGGSGGSGNSQQGGSAVGGGPGGLGGWGGAFGGFGGTGGMAGSSASASASGSEKSDKSGGADKNESGSRR